MVCKFDESTPTQKMADQTFRPKKAINIDQEWVNRDSAKNWIKIPYGLECSLRLSYWDLLPSEQEMYSSGIFKLQGSS